MSAELARIDRTDTEAMDILRSTVVADNITDLEFQLFVRVAEHSGLDPFRRQIYAVKRQGKLTIQTGIDGYRAIAARTGVYAGQEDATFRGLSRDQQHPGEATVVVYKIVAGLRCPFPATARWDEYYPGEGGVGAMWRKMPHNQLAKCAEALALRKAFPEELSGIVAEDAAGMMDTNVDSRTVETAAAERTREEIVGDRYHALPLDQRVAFTAWTKTLDPPLVRPYDDATLDMLEARLELLEIGDPPAAGTEEPTDAELVTCERCEATDNLVDGLCPEHVLPPDVGEV